MGSERPSGSPRARLPEFLAGDPIRGFGVLAIITAHAAGLYPPAVRRRRWPVRLLADLRRPAASPSRFFASRGTSSRARSYSPWSAARGCRIFLIRPQPRAAHRSRLLVRLDGRPARLRHERCIDAAVRLDIRLHRRMEHSLAQYLGQAGPCESKRSSTCSCRSRHGSCS